MERNTAQLAWSVLIGAFLAFCALLVAADAGVNWYLGYATIGRPASLQIIKGTALWLPAGSGQEVNAVGRTTVAEGEQIRTAPNSEVLLSFFDGSNVHLWPDTTVRILKARSSRYRLNETDLVIAQDDGHARYDVAIPSTAARHFEVLTPQGNAVLREGSYRVEVDDNATTVTVTTGSATVSGANDAVEVLKGEATTVTNLAPPAPVGSGIRDLLANGDFTDGLNRWQQGSRDLGTGPAGDVTRVFKDTRTYVELTREDAPRHGETFIHETVNVDVTDYSYLRLTYQYRVLAQHLADGAAPGSEFPLQVRLHYRDNAGIESTWTQGYFIAESDLHPSPSAIPVRPNFWQDATIDLLDPSAVSPRPAQILWVEFAASGLGYQSDVAQVQLLAE